MTELIIGAVIIGYSGFVIYKKVKDLKAGKSCCGGCSGCGARDKCGK